MGLVSDFPVDSTPLSEKIERDLTLVKHSRVRTLIVPGLFSDVKLFNSDVSDVLATCHNVVYLGNYLDVPWNKNSDEVRAHKTNNSMLVNSIYESVLIRGDSSGMLLGPNEILLMTDNEGFSGNETKRVLLTVWMEESLGNPVARAVGGALLTYGGLTYGEWVDIGKPLDADQAALLLKEKYMGTFYQGPAFYTNGEINYSANPIWAHPVFETMASWAAAPVACPFPQIMADVSYENDEVKAAFHYEAHPLSATTDRRIKVSQWSLKIRKVLFTVLDFDKFKNARSRFKRPLRMYVYAEPGEGYTESDISRNLTLHDEVLNKHIILDGDPRLESLDAWQYAKHFNQID